MNTLYLVKDGIVKREGNTIYYISAEGEKRSFPIERLKEIKCLGKVSLTSNAISTLLKRGIYVHFFNMHGRYEGSLLPKEPSEYGKILVEQVRHYIEHHKRMYIANEIVCGLKHNILRNLKYYGRKGKDMTNFIESIEKIEIKCKKIDELMGREAQLWKNYYDAFELMFPSMPLITREYRPPANEMNALISFGNSLLYSTFINMIHDARLSPAVSYLHEPRERNMSLALDMADVFKPVIVERIIAKIVNNDIIKEEHFIRKGGYYLNEHGKRIFIKAYKEKLESSVFHRKMKRHVSHEELMKMEVFALKKHLLENVRYRSFRAWW